MPERHPERGQTLVELAVVCSVMGLALLISAPNLAGYMRTQKVNKGIDALTSQLDLTKQRAVNRHCPVELKLRDPQTDEFWSYEDANSNGVWDNGERKHGPFKLPKGVTFDTIALQGNNRLVFMPSGVLQAGQGGPITLLDCDGHSRTLEVMATGMARRLPPTATTETVP